MSEQTIPIKEYFRVTDTLSDTVRELNLARNELARLRDEMENAVTEEEATAHNLELENSELKAENARLREALADIRDDARTGLKPDIYPTAESWLVSKVNRIAGMANRALRPEAD